ncbi:MAG: hypothetical protein IPJ85_18250 [Flavobacteriales bacterium]|nr:hypothetical protein [Flavobacteriales bacterium]
MNRRTVLSLCLLAIAGALGLGREFLFVNLNYQIDHLIRGTPYSYAHSAFQHWAQPCSADQLGTMKWVLSAAFATLNLALAIGMCRIHQPLRRLTAIVTAIFVVIAVFSVGLHLLSGDHGWMHAASVQLAHAIQYPIPVLILWALSLSVRPSAD